MHVPQVSHVECGREVTVVCIPPEMDPKYVKRECLAHPSHTLTAMTYVAVCNNPRQRETYYRRAIAADPHNATILRNYPAYIDAYDKFGFDYREPYVSPRPLTIPTVLSESESSESEPEPEDPGRNKSAYELTAEGGNAWQRSQQHMARMVRDDEAAEAEQDDVESVAARMAKEEAATELTAKLVSTARSSSTVRTTFSSNLGGGAGFGFSSDEDADEGADADADADADDESPPVESASQAARRSPPHGSSAEGDQGAGGTPRSQRSSAKQRARRRRERRQARRSAASSVASRSKRKAAASSLHDGSLASVRSAMSSARSSRHGGGAARTVPQLPIPEDKAVDENDAPESPVAEGRYRLTDDGAGPHDKDYNVDDVGGSGASGSDTMLQWVS